MSRKAEITTPFGEWLERQRKKHMVYEEIERSETLGEQADRIGIAIETLSRMAHGDRKVSKRMQEKIIKAYKVKGVDLSDFYKAIGYDE